MATKQSKDRGLAAGEDGQRAPTLAQDLRGLRRALVDGVVGASVVVEDMHGTIASVSPLLGDTRPKQTRGITRLVYRNVRGVTRLVGAALDLVLQSLDPVLQQRTDTRLREDVVAALNGVVGAYLADTGNPLAIRASLRQRGQSVDLATWVPARSRIVVMVHGSCMSDVGFLRNGQDHGRTLGEALDADVLYAHYNSGLPIHENGFALARLLQTLVTGIGERAHGDAPVELTLVGFSMGGLVLRSAIHQAAREAPAHGAWRAQVARLITIGTPHHGAPLERMGHMITRVMGATPYAAPIARLATIRGPGVQDLRHGAITEGDHAAVEAGDFADRRAPVPLPTGFPCHAIAGSLSTALPANALRARSDGMVPVASALGVHGEPARSLAFPAEHQRVIPACSHLGLLDHPEVAAQLRAWCVPA